MNSFAGQLEFFIPWKRLTKDPLIVKIEDVYATSIVTPDLCKPGVYSFLTFARVCVCICVHMYKACACICLRVSIRCPHFSVVCPLIAAGPL